MLTGVSTKRALVDILIARRPHVARRTGADGLSIHWVGITVGTLIARATDAGVIEVAEEPCSSMRALAVERCHSVMTGGPTVAGGVGAIVNVLTAVLASPTIHAHAVVSSMVIVACAPILAGIWHQLAFVNILSTVLPCPLWGALAVVRVHPIDTGPSVLTGVTGTVVNVHLTVLRIETWKTCTFIGGIPCLAAGSTILAWGGVAGHVESFTVASRVFRSAGALV